jgi:hypothetical protein
VTYTKIGSTLKTNFFIIYLLGPQIVIPYQFYFRQEPFAKIHFYTDPRIGADAIVLCLGIYNETCLKYYQWHEERISPKNEREDLGS